MQLQRLIKLSVPSDQAAFDAVVRHLEGMPRRAAIRRGGIETCTFETPDGKARCAVGALLDLDSPEKHRWAQTVSGGWYEIEWSGDISALEDLRSGEYLVEPGEVHSELLSALQEVHDDAGNWSDRGFRGWAAMCNVAAHHGLNTKALVNY